MRLVRSLGLIVSIYASTVAACGTSDRAPRNGFAEPGAARDGEVPFAIDDAGDGAAPPPPTIGTLRGRVTAPEGTVPVAGALVYLTTRTPEAIPTRAYCDTCVKLTPLEPYAYSQADGSFELPAYAAGKHNLVVQKGQFRRIRAIEVREGEQAVAAPNTRFPGKNDPANGDTIPRIAMVNGGFDKIDHSMAKLGIEEFYRYGDDPFGFESGPGLKTQKAASNLTTSASELGGYHIVMLPCAAFGGGGGSEQGSASCGGPIDAEKKALRSYVEGGGKLYVTDYAYEGVRQIWPGYVTFYDKLMTPMTNPGQGLGMACRGGAEDTPGTAVDPGLDAWLKAIGHPSITLQDSWSRIESVSPQQGLDETGAPATITPKVWMTSEYEGSAHPATVSFEQRCGRVLFSTYHTEGGAGAELLAQEKALLYILLEVGVCVGKLPPPPIR